MKNEFKGYSLFNDIEDVTLRDRNRAVILTNLMESNIDKATRKINIKGTSLILGYFSTIPEDQRQNVETLFKQEATRRGFIGA